MESGRVACGIRSRRCRCRTMMHGGMGPMMAGMGIAGILVIALVVLAIVALLKYVLKK